MNSLTGWEEGAKHVDTLGGGGGGGGGTTATQSAQANRACGGGGGLPCMNPCVSVDQFSRNNFENPPPPSPVKSGNSCSNFCC